MRGEHDGRNSESGNKARLRMNFGYERGARGRKVDVLKVGIRCVKLSRQPRIYESAAEEGSCTNRRLVAGSESAFLGVGRR